MVFLKNNQTLLLAAIFLALLLLIFTLPFKEKNYTFDWDQANDYESVAKIAKGKLTLIGPRVTSDTGFFLSPWHYYFLLPFYQLTNGSLYMGFWAALLVQYLLAVTAFILVRYWFGTLAGIATGILFAVPVSLVEWGFMYVPLLSLLFFFTCLKTKENPKLLPFLFLFFGFGCSTYAVFYALGLPLLYLAIYLLSKKKITWKSLFFGVGLAVIPYSPIIIFDLRHDFLNIKNILGFAGNQHSQGTRQAGYFLKVFVRAAEFSWLNRQLPTNVSFVVVLLTIIILVAGALILFNKNKTFMFLWLLSSLIPMAFYQGNVSEYYYAPVILLVPILMSGLLVKIGPPGKLFLIFLVSLLIGLRLKDKYQNSSGVTLADKINVVKALESLGTKYSVSYELRLGEDSGYTTVFETIGRNYVEDGSAQLYTLTHQDDIPTGGTRFAIINKLSIYKR